MSASGDMDIEPEVITEAMVDPSVSGNAVAPVPDELYQMNGLNIPAFDAVQPQREPIRDLCVKVHTRRSGKDNWTYLGRAWVSQEIVGHNSRVVVRSVASGKILVTFSDECDLQAEKRGNFVVMSCVDGNNVVCWSLNTSNNSETLKLLASIELACYKCRQALADPKTHMKGRRRIERIIKEDRRRRHRRRREEDSMVEAFGRTQLD